MKKILVLLLSVVMLFTLGTVTALATDTGNETTVTTEEELNSALTAGGNVKLGADIDVNTTIEIQAGIEVTLDLNGKNITSAYQSGSTTKHIYPINNYGTLTIEDSVGTGSIVGRGIYNQDGATLTINSAKIVAEDFNGGACVWGYGSSSKVYLNNATMIGYTGVVSSEGYLEINGGTYTCYSGITDEGEYTSPTYNIRAYNGLKITDGTFTSRHGVISLGGGEGVIENGSFTIEFYAATTSNVVYVYDSATLTINGGEFISDNTTGKADSGAAVLISGTSASATINDGTYVGMNGMVSGNAETVAINGGSYDTVWDYNDYGSIEEFVSTGAVVEVAGEALVKNEDGTTTAVVAIVEGTGYATLSEAIAAAQKGETVTLLADVEIAEMITVPQGAELIFDLNGKSVVAALDSTRTDGGHIYALNNYGVLTIKDSVGTGTYSARGLYNGYNASGDNYTGAKLIIEGGNFVALDSTGGAAIFNYGIVEINGGTFKRETGYALNNSGSMTITNASIVESSGGVYCQGNGTVVVNNANIVLTGSYHGFYAYNGVVTINNISLTTNATAIMVEGANVTVNDGKISITSTPYLLDGTAGTLNINGGSFTGENIRANGMKLNISGGTFTATTFAYDTSDIVVTGGTYATENISKFVQENYNLNDNGDGTYTVAEAKTYVAQIGENKYETLEDAFANAQDGETVTLLANITAEAMITTPDNIAITLDLNGYTIEAASGVGYVLYITTGDTLTINDSKGTGGIVNNATYSYGVLNQGTLTINGGSFVGDSAVWNGYDTINAIATINGGTFTTSGDEYGFAIGNSGTMVVNNATVNGILYTFGSLTINDGEYSCVGAYSSGEGLPTVATTATTVNGGKITYLQAIAVTGTTTQNNINVAGGEIEAVDLLIQEGAEVKNKVEISAGTVQSIGAYTYNDEGETAEISATHAGVVVTGGTLGQDALEAVATVKIGESYYLTLEDAFANAQDGDTITLIDDVVVNTKIDLYTSVTLELNGKRITPAQGASMKSGIIRVREGGALTVEDSVGTGEINYNGELNVWNAISVIGPNAELTVNGGKLVGYYYGIAGNGSYDGTTITINGGEVSSVEGTGSGIYHPQSGVLTVTNGKITGATGIYFKSGTLVISGGEINGTGVKKDYGYVASGSDATGDALVIENVGDATGYLPVESVSITGGTFNSTNASAVASYAATNINPDAEEVTGFISGGTFNTAVDSTLCAYGYVLNETANGYVPSKATLNDIIIFKGYSVFEEGVGVTAGYTVDKALFEAYCEQNGVTISLGAVFAATQLDANAIYKSFAGLDLTTSYNISLKDMEEDHKSRAFVMALYIEINGEKQFVTGDGTTTAIVDATKVEAITYNGVATKEDNE